MTDKGGREALLAYTINFLRENNSNQLRTEYILKETKTSFSSLYHHFESREVLIRKAQLALCEEFFTRITNTSLDALQNVRDFEEFSKLIASLTHERTTNPLNLAARKRQANLIGAAFSDPQLKTELRKLMLAGTNKLVPTYQKMQADGIINPKLDVRAFIAARTALLHSRVFMEIDPLTTQYFPDWNRCSIQTSLDILKPEGKVVWNPEWALRLNNSIPVEDRPMLPQDQISLRVEEWSPIKKKIVQSAISELNHTPLPDIRLSKIAKNIGVASSLLYKYFKDKDELFQIANLYRYSERTLSKIPVEFNKEDISSLSEFHHYLRELFIGAENYQGEEPGYDALSIARSRWVVIGQSLFDESTREQIIKFTRQNAYYWLPWIQGLQDKGVIDQNINPFSYIFWLVSAYQAYPVYELMLEEEYSHAELQKMWWEIIFNERGNF